MEKDPVAVNEQDLIEKARQGDRNAFGELVRFHYSGVVNVVYRLCADTNLAEDMAQEAFLRAWTHLDSFQPNSSLRNWLYRIAINASLDFLRRRSEDPIDEERTLMVPDETPGPETLLISGEETKFLQEAMKALPGAARTVLVLREYGELTYQEIAAVLDIPLGTVMSRLSYARSRLRDVYKARLLQLEVEYA